MQPLLEDLKTLFNSNVKDNFYGLGIQVNGFRPFPETTEGNDCWTYLKGQDAV